MGVHSLTSTDSFRLRAQQSEQWRIALMLGALMVLAALVSLRRIAGDEVLSDDSLAVFTVGAFAMVIAYEAALFVLVRSANRVGRLLPSWWLWSNAAIELAFPLFALAKLEVSGPVGPVGALSAPMLLLIPIIIMLSVLRLRPAFTLWTGLGAGAVHAALTTHALQLSREPLILYPYLFSYSIALILTGVAGAFVSREVRGFVHNAADEAIAREQARRRLESVEHDLSIARDIQRGLLPSTTPSLPGYDIAGVNFPADQTGGDYYDWQKLPDGRLGVALADATGHGIGPALIMAVCRAYSRASAPLVPKLGPLLERLNALVCADVSGGRFITFVIAVADGASPRLELLSAGHGPLLLYRAADRSIEQMSGNGLPLGILPDQAYGPPRTIDMQVGDILLLLTDGYFEAQRPGDGDAFGIPRLEEVLRARASEDSASLLGHIDTAVRAFMAGGPQADDMTAVAIKYVGF